VTQSSDDSAATRHDHRIGRLTMRILIIDDDPFMLKLLSRQLDALGMGNVTASECPVAALSVITEDPNAFDVLILDLNMPGMDGIQFLRELAWQKYTGAIMLLSGEDERILAAAERLARAEGLPVLGRLAKPVKPADLQLMLARTPVVRTPEAETLPESHVFSEEDIRSGLEGREFINYYQPQVSFADGSLIGVETLVRWDHPDEGIVPPHRFIAVAEETGLINELTTQVIRLALADGHRWLALGLDLRVSVNVSMADLRALDFPDRIAKVADRYAFPLDHLALEITESQLAQDWQLTLDVAARLRLKGIVLAIDDFGTGYSSLSQLRDLPFNELKLDRSFVHGAGNTASLGSIVASHLDMAQRLGMKVVAEGIEDARDWLFLERSGCDIGQGYFMGRPMPPANLLLWQEEWNTRYGGLDRSHHD